MIGYRGVKRFTVLLLAGIALAGIALAGAASADTIDARGYDKTVWGMSPDQVLSVEGSAALLQSDGTVLLSDIVIASHSFDGVLSFPGRGVGYLRSVVLVAQAASDTDTATVFTDSDAWLVASYGQATSRTGQADAEWVLPTTTVRLRRVQSAEGVWSVSIAYAPSN
jgi:hypothetical protein